MPIATTAAIMMGLGAAGAFGAKKAAGALAGKGGTPSAKPDDLAVPGVPGSEATQAAAGAAAKQRKRSGRGLFGNIATMLGDGTTKLGNGGAKSTYGAGKTMLGL